MPPCFGRRATRAVRGFGLPGRANLCSRMIVDGDERRRMGALFPPVVTEQLVPVVWQDKWSPMKPFLLAQD